MTMNVERKKERRRPKKIWLSTIEHDMRDVGVCVDRGVFKGCAHGTRAPY
jgi:hypothetical protein